MPQGLPESFEIYDYINDPMEQNNLIHQLPEKTAQAQSYLEKGIHGVSSASEMGFIQVGNDD